MCEVPCCEEMSKYILSASMFLLRRENGVCQECTKKERQKGMGQVKTSLRLRATRCTNKIQTAKRMVTALKFPKIEPYFAVASKTRFVKGFQENPDRPQFIAADVSAAAFSEHAEFDYFGQAESIWIDAMGKWIAGDVLLVTDDIESGIFVMHAYMGYMQFLGRLVSNSKFYNEVYRSFAELACATNETP